MEHFFFANATASKDCYIMMRVRKILWTIFFHSYCKRLSVQGEQRSERWRLALGNDCVPARYVANMCPLDKFGLVFG